MNAFTVSYRGSGFSWSPERQVIFHRSRVYVHEGQTPTSPSHDLAHLLIAMSSDLLWLPQGDPDEIRIAEYNAVFLERFLSNAYNCVVLQSIGPSEVLAKTLQYARWFVEQHYAPFPIAAEEAYRQFCWGIHANALSCLAAHFFVQRARELKVEQRNGCWDMRLQPRVTPILDRNGWKFQKLVRQGMERITSLRTPSKRCAGTSSPWSSTCLIPTDTQRLRQRAPGSTAEDVPYAKSKSSVRKTDRMLRR